MHDNRQDAAAQPLQVLVAAKLYAPEEIAGPVAVVLEGTTIRAIWQGTDVAAARRRLADNRLDQVAEVADLGRWTLAPGYIDLHIHGFHGHDVTTGTQEDVAFMARELPRVGVTSFFPTIATLGYPEIIQQVRRVADAAENQVRTPVAEILGLRLEGPFLSRIMKGAQYEPGIRPPDAAEMEELAAEGRGWVRIVDYAPEEDRDARFLATLVRLRILACMGHTAATYEQATRAIDGGVRHSAHLFNAMSALEHRAPGVAGALLTDRRATIEVIADGVHVHPAMIKLVIAARGSRDVALITDSIAAAGLSEGEYEFVGRKVVVRDGAVRLANGTLAGSILTLEQAVRNIVTFTGLGWSEAIGMATHNPARIAGVALRKGRVAPGSDADLVALDNEGFVQRTWVRGSLVT